MNPSEFFGKFTSRYFWGNICAMAIVVVVACAGVKYGLDVYTHHGESISVPDVRRKSFADAQYLLEDAGMQVVVSDTGYVRNLPPDCILEQSPLLSLYSLSLHSNWLGTLLLLHHIVNFPLPSPLFTPNLEYQAVIFLFLVYMVYSTSTTVGFLSYTL